LTCTINNGLHHLLSFAAKLTGGKGFIYRKQKLGTGSRRDKNTLD
jgi:hypothetical protein